MKSSFLSIGAACLTLVSTCFAAESTAEHNATLEINQRPDGKVELKLVGTGEDIEKAIPDLQAALLYPVPDPGETRAEPLMFEPMTMVITRSRRGGIGGAMDRVAGGVASVADQVSDGVRSAGREIRRSVKRLGKKAEQFREQLNNATVDKWFPIRVYCVTYTEKTGPNDTNNTEKQETIHVRGGHDLAWIRAYADHGDANVKDVKTGRCPPER